MSEIYWGHGSKPLMLYSDNAARTERVSAYVEPNMLYFLEEYRTRMGMRSVSEALRRLAIIGAQAEGYHFDGELIKAEKP